MRELDVNTQQKNLLEEDKLQHELFKLSRSGRRATHQIDRYEKSVATHFLDVTCKTDHVTDNRKHNSFQVMKLGRKARPVSAVEMYGSKPIREEGKRRPASAAVHYIPSSEYEGGERRVVYLDSSGRPDIERIHRERSDKFYHHKIDKMMTMMDTRNAKRRISSKSRQTPDISPRADPYDLHNLPETIPESAQPMSRSDAEYQLKKIRTSFMSKQPSMLYGEMKEDMINPGNKKRSGKTTKKSSQDNQSPRGRASSVTQNEYEPWTVEGKLLTRKENHGRRSTPKPPDIYNHMSDLSNSDDETKSPTSLRISHQSKTSLTGINTDQMDAIGLKMKQFQDGRYPSRFLDPNPDCMTRHRPFPVILDKRAYEEFCLKVARVKTTSQMRRDLEDLISKYGVESSPWSTAAHPGDQKSSTRPTTPRHAWNNHGPQFDS